MRAVPGAERGQDDPDEDRQGRPGAGEPDDALEDTPVGDSGATRVAGRRYFPALPLAGDAAGAANCAWLALSFATSSSKDSVRMILLNWAR
jgi:hypothetical protein